VTAGGTALLSEIEGHGGEDMISMFHLDGPDRLLLTHYCGAGNQPRMQATASSDGKTFVFDFVDATNLVHPEDGHMKRMVISMVDSDHHTEEWIFVEHGKETKEVFDLWKK
jgi:putative NIF3 family GTP cyclohydrolase 1 type 2